MRRVHLPSRRQWLLGCGAAGAATLVGGCAFSGLPDLRIFTAAERTLLAPPARILPILQYRLAGSNLGALLRQRARSARDLPRPSLARLDRLMRATLASSGGVGLAAPQVGFSRRMVLVQLQKGPGPRGAKRVLTCVDPHILRRSADRVDGYEACLSIRGVGGKVARARWVDLSYYDLKGRLRQHRSTGWEARIFQHELDHLDGRLYVDLVDGPLVTLEELRRRRRKSRRRPSASTARFESGSPLAWSPDGPDEVVLL